MRQTECRCLVDIANTPRGWLAPRSPQQFVTYPIKHLQMVVGCGRVSGGDHPIGAAGDGGEGDTVAVRLGGNVAAVLIEEPVGALKTWLRMVSGPPVPVRNLISMSGAVPYDR